MKAKKKTLKVVNKTIKSSGVNTSNISKVGNDQTDEQLASIFDLCNYQRYHTRSLQNDIAEGSMERRRSPRNAVKTKLPGKVKKDKIRDLINNGIKKFKNARSKKVSLQTVSCSKETDSAKKVIDHDVDTTSIKPCSLVKSSAIKINSDTGKLDEFLSEETLIPRYTSTPLDEDDVKENCNSDEKTENHKELATSTGTSSNTDDPQSINNTVYPAENNDLNVTIVDGTDEVLSTGSEVLCKRDYGEIHVVAVQKIAKDLNLSKKQDLVVDNLVLSTNGGTQVKSSHELECNVNLIHPNAKEDEVEQETCISSINQLISGHMPDREIKPSSGCQELTNTNNSITDVQERQNAKDIDGHCGEVESNNILLNLVSGLYDGIGPQLEPLECNTHYLEKELSSGSPLFQDSGMQDESTNDICNISIEANFENGGFETIVKDLCNASAISSFLDDTLENTVAYDDTTQLEDTMAYEEEMVPKDDNLLLHSDEVGQNINGTNISVDMKASFSENSACDSVNTHTHSNSLANIHIENNEAADDHPILAATELYKIVGMGVHDADASIAYKNYLPSVIEVTDIDHSRDDVTVTQLSEGKEESLKKKIGVSLKKQVTNILKTKSMKKVKKKNFTVGDLVIGKIALFGWWFGKVVKHDKQPEKGCLWIYWYGDHKTLQLPTYSLFCYTEFHSTFNKSRLKQKKYKTAVSEFLEEAYRLLSCSFIDKQCYKKGKRFQKLLQWALKGFHVTTTENTHDNHFSKSPNSVNLVNPLAERVLTKDTENSTTFGKEIQNLLPLNGKSTINRFPEKKNSEVVKEQDLLPSGESCKNKDEQCNINHASKLMNENELKDEIIDLLNVKSNHQSTPVKILKSKPQQLDIDDQLKSEHSDANSEARKRVIENQFPSLGDMVDNFVDCTNTQNNSNDDKVDFVNNDESVNIDGKNVDDNQINENITTGSKRRGIKLCHAERKCSVYDTDTIKVHSKETKMLVSEEYNIVTDGKAGDTTNISVSGDVNEENIKGKVHGQKSVSSPSQKILSNSNNSSKKSFKVDDLVIGRLQGFGWWFGKIISYCSVLKKTPVEGHNWVFWYGDHRITEISNEFLEHLSMFQQRYVAKKMNNRVYKNAVKEILLEAAKRSSKNDLPVGTSLKSGQEKLRCLIDWAKCVFKEKASNQRDLNNGAQININVTTNDDHSGNFVDQDRKDITDFTQNLVDKSGSLSPEISTSSKHSTDSKSSVVNISGSVIPKSEIIELKKETPQKIIKRKRSKQDINIDHLSILPLRRQTFLDASSAFTKSKNKCNKISKMGRVSSKENNVDNTNKQKDHVEELKIEGISKEKEDSIILAKYIKGCAADIEKKDTEKKQINRKHNSSEVMDSVEISLSGCVNYSSSQDILTLQIQNHVELSSTEHNREINFRVGDLIIANLEKFDWWFGKVISCSEIKQRPPLFGCCWVYWFGDHTINEMLLKSLESLSMFITRFDPCRMNRGIYKKAVKEILDEAAIRCDKTDLLDKKGKGKCEKERLRCLIDWAIGGFNPMGIDILYTSIEGNSAEVHQNVNNILETENNRIIRSTECLNQTISENRFSTPVVKEKMNHFDIPRSSPKSHFLGEKHTESLFSDSGFHETNISESLNQSIDFKKVETPVTKVARRRTGIQLNYDSIVSSASRRQTFLDARESFSKKKKDRNKEEAVNKENSIPKVKTSDPTSSNLTSANLQNDDKEKTPKKKRGRKRKSEGNIIPPQSLVSLPLISSKEVTKEFKIGDLIIGKLKRFNWWFGKIISHKTANQRQPLYGNCWVYWFGDHKVSEMLIQSLESLEMFSHRFLHHKMKGVYERAVREVLNEAAKKCSKEDLPDKESTDSMNKRLTCLIDWAKNCFQPMGVDAIYACGEENISDDSDLDITTTSNINDVTTSSDDSDDQTHKKRSKNISTPPELSADIKKLFDSVADGKRNIEKLCLGCGDAKIEVPHPLFEGGLCKECMESFMECAYLYDEDGYQMFCAICSEGDEIILCDRPGCCRSYCTICIDMFCGVGYAARISKSFGNWDCFMCTGERVHILKRRDDWQEKLKDIFQSSLQYENFTPMVYYDSIPFEKRRPIRVLALFDGIATGYHVLKELDLEIELYVASEVDSDATNVAEVRHGDKIKHVGEVRDIYKKHIDDWGPFDLLIGGSPCNDLSIANPLRKGIYEGTGRLFFEYYRIKQLLLPHPVESRPFFWLFENVVGMRHEDRDAITRFLQCPPVLVNSKAVSAQHRSRYFWGNLPGMNRQLYPLSGDRVTLQDCLEPNCGRIAKLEKVRCITTMTNSLKQTKNAILPIEVKKDSSRTEDGLWLTEIERIFGFPQHYTDVGNMGQRQRQKLLGKSWCVPVMRHLFSPLKNYFKTKSIYENDALRSIETQTV